MTQTTTFNTIQSLYTDMVTHNQSFILSQIEYDSSHTKQIIEGGTIYRLVELKRGKLEFHSNKFGGSDLRISGKVLSSMKVDNPDSKTFSEYKIHIEGRAEPFILLACKKR